MYMKNGVGLAWGNGGAVWKEAKGKIGTIVVILSIKYNFKNCEIKINK